MNYMGKNVTKKEIISMEKLVSSILTSNNVLFMFLGAVMIFAMHAGFAFLEVGSVRKKNQVNALVKIITDWSISTITYFVIGFPLAYGIHFLKSADKIASMGMIDSMPIPGFDLMHFFFLLTFAAAIPAIISGGIAERAKFWPQAIAGGIFAGVIYPLFESMIWGQNQWFQNFIKSFSGSVFHDYAGSVVVHSIGGWLALPAIMILGPRLGRYSKGASVSIPVSNIPVLGLGSWILAIGWFGFNVMSAQNFQSISSLVAINSLFAMVGGVLFALVISRNDSVAIYNGALAGLIAVCAGSDLFHPLGAFFVGGIGSAIFIKMFTFETEVLKIDDVLGVWPLHGVVGSWGGIAAGIFGSKMFGGIGGISFLAQLSGTFAAIVFALVSSFIVYLILDKTVGVRISEMEEIVGCDEAIHHTSAYPEDASNELDVRKEIELLYARLDKLSRQVV